MNEKLTRTLELSASDIERLLEGKLRLSDDATFRFEVGTRSMGHMEEMGGYASYEFKKLVITDKIPLEEVEEGRGGHLS